MVYKSLAQTPDKYGLLRQKTLKKNGSTQIASMTVTARQNFGMLVCNKKPPTLFLFQYAVILPCSPASAPRPTFVVRIKQKQMKQEITSGVPGLLLGQIMSTNEAIPVARLCRRIKTEL